MEDGFISLTVCVGHQINRSTPTFDSLQEIQDRVNRRGSGAKGLLAWIGGTGVEL